MVCGVAGNHPALGDVGAEMERYPMIDELDSVVLKRDLPDARLAAGDADPPYALVNPYLALNESRARSTFVDP